MNQELLNKALHERPLTAEETLALDMALEQNSCAAVAGLVRGLESDAPNMEWRSGLNTKLAAASRSRQRRAWLGMIGLGAPIAACAAALAFWVMQPRSEGSQSPVAQESYDSSVEAILASSHREVERASALDVSLPEEAAAYDWSSL